MSDSNKEPLKDKELSNPFSSGAGGPRFELQVMSAFAVLMLARGTAPCIDCAPITSLSLQARKSGYRIDDFVAYAGGPAIANRRKLLVQVKHGISFTKKNKEFGETIAAAWRDFNEVSLFTRKKDAIAIVTGPLSATDSEGLRTILDWARTQESAQVFFQNVELAKFSSKLKREKLRVIRKLINASVKTTPSDEEVFQFLRHLHILGLDLDVISGMTHMFLRTIIGVFNLNNLPGYWERIYYVVSDFNYNAGALSTQSFPQEIQDAFASRAVEEMPAYLTTKIPPKEVS